MNDFIIKESTEEETRYIDVALGTFNASKVPYTPPFSQETPFIPLEYCIKDEEERIIAGIKAELYGWGILTIYLLWVSEDYRGHGLGTQLLKKVEGEAMSIGCSLIHLDTFDFQAKDFYLAHGFEIFGVLDDCPPDHKRFYLKKKI